MASGSTIDDWQLNKSVLESNKYVLENQLFCDVKFVFTQEDITNKKDNVISAHKFVLITRSPVFCAMFTGPAKDENPEIRIEDVDKETFMEMLRYMYAEEADITGYNVLSVLYCAKKYMIPVLEKKCEDFLEEQIDPSNVCFILEQASIMEETDLENKCLEMVDFKTDKVLKTESFTNISQITLKKILIRDTLNVKELDVYKACISWADAECERQEIEIDDHNRREVLGDLRYLIRFPTMDQDDFNKTVATSKVLTPEEGLGIILHKKNLPLHYELNFPREGRLGTCQDCFFEGTMRYSNTGTGSVKQKFVVECSNEQIDIDVCSVYFIDSTHSGVLSVCGGLRYATVGQTDKHRLDEKVYEAVFDPPLSGPSRQVYAISFCPASGLSSISSAYNLTGPNTIQWNDITITMNTDPWYFIVGFKIKKSPSISQPRKYQTSYF